MIKVVGSRLKFCAPGLFFGSTVGVISHFNVLHARTRFRRYQGRPVPFSCVRAPGLVFRGIEGVSSRFHVLDSLTRFRRYRGHRLLFSSFGRLDMFFAVPKVSGPVFMFWAPRLIFGSTEGVGSRF
jgi:hypothetical protein